MTLQPYLVRVARASTGEVYLEGRLERGIAPHESLWVHGKGAGEDGFLLLLRKMNLELLCKWAILDALVAPLNATTPSMRLLHRPQVSGRCAVMQCHLLLTEQHILSEIQQCALKIHSDAADRNLQQACSLALMWSLQQLINCCFMQALVAQ